MYEQIFTVSILIFTGIIIYYFIVSYKDHKKELEKITFLEKEQEENNKNIEIARKKTTPCPHQGLNDPRQCYFGSDYKCSWNTEAMRCDKK